MTDFKLREIMYHLTCLRSASDPCVPSRTEGFGLVQLKTLFTTVPVMVQAQSESRPVTHHKSIPPCHLRIRMNMAAILAQVFSPATRTQCPNMGNKILIPMQQFRITKTTALVRKNRRAV
jgi:hypothetical protein